MRLLRRPAADPRTTIFFATDVHGSERTWRKFLNAAAFYGADVLVMGGDVMGKLAIPIIREAGGTHRATIHGRVERLETADDVARAKERIANLGFYEISLDEDEYATIRTDAEAIETLWRRLASERLERWIAMAEERLGPAGIRCYVSGGNDDLTEVMAALPVTGTRSFVGCEGRVVSLDDRHQMVSMPYVNPTPWNTPREAEEDRLAAMIEEQVAGLPDPSRAIFNFHAPPVEFDPRHVPIARPLDGSAHASRPRRAAGAPRRGQHLGPASARVAPAATRPARPHPRVAIGGTDRSHKVYQSGKRVRRGRASRLPDLDRRGQGPRYPDDGRLICGRCGADLRSQRPWR